MNNSSESMLLLRVLLLLLMVVVVVVVVLLLLLLLLLLLRSPHRRPRGGRGQDEGVVHARLSVPPLYPMLPLLQHRGLRNSNKNIN